jgi:hypothetical protein
LDWEEIGKGTYAVVLQADARWIDDGTPPHNMLEDLLASPKAKTAKDGSKYLIIPFKHSKTKTTQTPQQRQLLSAIQSEMKKKNISKEVVRNSDGSPKMGLVHSFDVANPKHRKQVSPGFQGPQGEHFQTKPKPQGQEGPGGRPYLWATRVYQNAKKGADGKPKMGSDGHPEVERSTFTFRVASSKQAGKGMWDHPGNEPLHMMEEAAEWARRQFEDTIAPELIRSLGF